MDVLPLYKTCNEVAALRDSEEVNELWLYFEAVQLDWARPS